jgi:hypothetical protein
MEDQENKTKAEWADALHRATTENAPQTSLRHEER